MRLNHYVVLTPPEELAEELQRSGLAIKAKRMSAFTMYADDPRWHRMQGLFQECNATIRQIYEYSKQELDESPYLDLRSGKEGGYPHPRKNDDWRRATYDLSQYCPACGSHAHQIQPFRMIGEPEFGESDVVSLGWVYDQLFVRKAIWNQVFQPFGIESLPVISHKTGLPLETVVQLCISEVSSVPLDVQDKWESSTCATCGQKKNCGSPQTPFFPPFAGHPEGRLFKTQELFGAGLISARAIVCSNDLYRAMVSAGVRGFQFEPQEVGSTDEKTLA
jgi:hypothetical protein